MVSKVKLKTYVSKVKGVKTDRRDLNSMNMGELASEFDKAFQDGIFVNPNGKVPNIRFKDMDEWCQKHNRDPETLTEKELEQFRVD